MYKNYAHFLIRKLTTLNDASFSKADLLFMFYVGRELINTQPSSSSDARLHLKNPPGRDVTPSEPIASTGRSFRCFSASNWVNRWVRRGDRDSRHVSAQRRRLCVVPPPPPVYLCHQRRCAPEIETGNDVAYTQLHSPSVLLTRHDVFKWFQRKRDYFYLSRFPLKDCFRLH